MSARARPPRRAASSERELDALLVTILVNVRWLTGFTGSNGVASSARDGLRRFLTDFRYLTQSAERGRRRVRARSIGERTCSSSRRRAARTGPALGFDDAHMSVSSTSACARLLPRRRRARRRPAGWSSELRAVKDADEVARIRAAAELADAALPSDARGRPRGPHRARRSRSRSSWRCAASAPRRPRFHADRRAGAARRAAARRCRATSRSRAGTLVDDRLGRAARRLLLGLHAHVRDRASPTARGARGLRARARAQLAGARRGAPRRRRARRSTPPRARSSTPPATASTSATGSATASGSRSTRAPRLSARVRRRRSRPAMS